MMSKIAYGGGASAARVVTETSQLTNSDVGVVCAPFGRGGGTLTLPTNPIDGVWYEFVVVTGTVTVQSTAPQVLYLGASVSSSGGTISSSTVGSYLKLRYVGTDKWASLSSGTWAAA